MTGVPALHINGGGLPSRHEAEQDCLSAIALTLDVTVAPAA
jgi:hypothetical protein